MVPSCMSFCWLGTTKETVGNLVKSAGKLVNGMLSAAGIALAEAPCQSDQGLCLRA